MSQAALLYNTSTNRHTVNNHKNMWYVLLLCLVITACCQGYYWKEWHGLIPKDAFIAGSDSRGKAYIAQVYIPKTGVYIGEIFSGQQEVIVNTDVYGRKPIRYSDYDIKILCTNKMDLYWMVGNIKTTKQMIINKGLHLVKGGVTKNQNRIYIGKYHNADNVFIGNVDGDWEDQYYIYYADIVPMSNFSTYYEVLMTDIDKSFPCSN